ncbi:hypothetical protein IFM89_000237 [Coptis chinensis]|uniref:Uncharacterized protein n=1 Tax=Coptis chinensis TaxID=261450 RepID=A0A835IHY1_9MAGN|nr:hypothetical protein IFM89_000237 [Coptis chinensis]
MATVVRSTKISPRHQFLIVHMIPVYDHSNVTAIISKVFMDNKPRVNYCTLRDQQTVHEKYISPHFEVDSNTIFNEKKEHWENTSKTLAKGYSSSREVDDVLSSFVVFLAGLMIRAMSFQMNVFISFFTFPVWLMYYSFMFVFDPFSILKWVQNRTLGVFFAGWYCFCESVSLPLKGQKSVLKLVVKVDLLSTDGEVTASPSYPYTSNNGDSGLYHGKEVKFPSVAAVLS